MVKAISIFFVTVLFSVRALSVQVAFIEGYHPNGARVQLSPGDRFFHVAIKVDGLWYQSIPGHLVKGDEHLGESPSFRVTTTLENSSLEISTEDLKPYLGLPFDGYFNWCDPDRTYCSKLVANILNVEPSEMLFESGHWGSSQKREMGNLGISPDELYEKLLTLGFTAIDLRLGTSMRCKSLLN